MGVINELTYLHMEIFGTIEEMERRVARLIRLDRQGDPLGQQVDRLAASALRLRQLLQLCQHRQEEEVFARVRRICGEDTEDVVELREEMRRGLAAVDRFIAQMPASNEEMTRGTGRSLREALTALTEAYERRREAEQRFLQSYSTLLYPGGLATE